MKVEKITYLTRHMSVSPLERLRILGPVRNTGIRVISGMENGKVKNESIEQGQLVAFQRDFPADLQTFDHVLQLAKTHNRPIAYDIDDLLISLPEEHPDRKSNYYAPSLMPIVQAILLSDLVTVSTRTLHDVLLPFNKNIAVLPNFLDDSIWSLKYPQKKSSDAPLVLGYMGGDSHRPDLEWISDVLVELAKKYGERIQFLFYGVQPPENLAKVAPIKWIPIKTYNYAEFAADFQSLDVDIFIAPLVDNLFNRCKSPIKFFEYSSLGVPGVYSRLNPYTDVITDGQEGLLASSHSEWHTSLVRLIEDGELRRRLASQAQETIRNKWLMSRNSHLWEIAFQDLLEKGPNREASDFLPRDIIVSITKQVSEYFNKANENISQFEENLRKVNIERNALESEKTHLQNEFGSLEEKYQAAQYELREIYISKAWRLALMVRKLRGKVLPPGSRMEMYAKGFYRSLKVARGRLQSNPKARAITKAEGPLVSVVIPIYDRTDVLIESIESILSQSYQNFELILVCDGSPQETLEIVRRYEKSSPKVRAFYFRNNSGNAVRGRNKGIKEARGEYLAFQDSDDIADPNRLRNSLEAVHAHNADVVYGGWRAIIDGTREVDLENGQEVFSPDCDLEFLKQICVPCQSTVLARVSALRAVGGVNPAMRYREDHELWLRLAHHGYKFKAVEKVLTNLRLHKGNLELSLKDKDDHWRKLALEEYQKKLVMKPKIGYVVPGTGISGGIAVICEHVNRLILRGYDVSIITEDNSESVPWFPGLLGDVIPIQKMDNNYDILTATLWSTAYTVDRLSAKRKFYLVQSDETRFFEPGDPSIKLARKTYTMNLELLTIAKWLQRWLKEEFDRDAVYVTNAINEEIIHPVDPIEKKTDKVRVLLEGPISIPFKGMEDAFKAVDGLDCEVWCVSSAGKPKPEWKCDRFFYQVPFGKMKEIYSSCDIMLKMSRVESFCLPPLEMMACGGTAVLGEVTGIDEYAVHNYNSLIVPQGDVNGAHEALKCLIEDEGLRKRLSENGKKTADLRRWSETIDILEKVYTEGYE